MTLNYPRKLSIFEPEVIYTILRGLSRARHWIWASLSGLQYRVHLDVIEPNAVHDFGSGWRRLRKSADHLRFEAYRICLGHDLGRRTTGIFTCRNQILAINLVSNSVSHDFPVDKGTDSSLNTFSTA
jgi:hypothetical protein